MANPTADPRKKIFLSGSGPEKNKNDSRIRIHNTDLDSTTGFSAVAANPQTEWPKLLEKSYIILFKPCDCSQNNVAWHRVELARVGGELNQPVTNLEAAFAPLVFFTTASTSTLQWSPILGQPWPKLLNFSDLTGRVELVFPTWDCLQCSGAATYFRRLRKSKFPEPTKLGRLQAKKGSSVSRHKHLSFWALKQLINNVLF